MFSEKQQVLDRNIVIIENEKIYSDNKEVAEKLNNFFIETVENLEIDPFILQTENNCSEQFDQIDEIINDYEFHPSIVKIKEQLL